MIGQGRPGWGPEEPEKDRKRGKICAHRWFCQGSNYNQRNGKRQKGARERERRTLSLGRI